MEKGQIKGTKQKLIHVSFDIVPRLVPRVPNSRLDDEDSTIKRICVTDSVQKSLQAVPDSGEILYAMEKLGLPLLIHAYYLEADPDMVRRTDEIVSMVPDASFTGECWVLSEPVQKRRVDYEVISPIIHKVKMPDGTYKRVLFGCGIKRVKYGDNKQNFCDLFHVHVSDAIYKFIQETYFGCIMKNIGEELYESRQKKKSNEGGN